MNGCAKDEALTRPLAIGDFDLIYGVGNVGREDDGLGWAMIEELESLYPEQRYLRRYQLFFEDVAILKDAHRVLFIDGCKLAVSGPMSAMLAQKRQNLDGGFALEQVAAEMDMSFTSHSISLPSIAAMSQLCYQYCPEIWLLSIQGYQWELKIGLSSQARENFRNALKFITRQGIVAHGKPVFPLVTEFTEAKAAGSLLSAAV